MSDARVSYFREIGREAIDQFFHKGYKRRYFFPHRVYLFPKCGPDGYKLARRVYKRCDLDRLWEIVLYADRSMTAEFPEELFFDDDLVWHQQQFGKVGQIATANLIVDESSLYSMVHLSDIVQRISRRREHKTRIENRFKGWNHMLLNSILHYALENNLNPVRTPTSDLAIRHSDPARTVDRVLFERTYDRNIQQLFTANRTDDWWVIDIHENRDRIIPLKARKELMPHEKTICLCHDIEKGFGHTGIDPALEQSAHESSAKSLDEMLSIEERMGLKATYNVLGLILPEVREKIESSGHCLAFHSYDHQIEATSPQLPRCREVDFRIKGYRPPQSNITPELSDENLCFHNFEWLASSAWSLQMSSPELRHRIVKIPLAFDDFVLYDQNMAYKDWERGAIEAIQQNDFVAFSLHDCYAPRWLPYYAGFLEKISGLGRWKTLDAVAGEVILSSSQ